MGEYRLLQAKAAEDAAPHDGARCLKTPRRCKRKSFNAVLLRAWRLAVPRRCEYEGRRCCALASIFQKPPFRCQTRAHFRFFPRNASMPAAVRKPIPGLQGLVAAPYRSAGSPSTRTSAASQPTSGRIASSARPHGEPTDRVAGETGLWQHQTRDPDSDRMPHAHLPTRKRAGTVDSLEAIPSS